MPSVSGWTSPSSLWQILLWFFKKKICSIPLECDFPSSLLIALGPGISESFPWVSSQYFLLLVVWLCQSFILSSDQVFYACLDPSVAEAVHDIFHVSWFSFGVLDSFSFSVSLVGFLFRSYMTFTVLFSCLLEFLMKNLFCLLISLLIVLILSSLSGILFASLLLYAITVGLVIFRRVLLF